MNTVEKYASKIVYIISVIIICLTVIVFVSYFPPKNMLGVMHLMMTITAMVLTCGICSFVFLDWINNYKKILVISRCAM